MRVASVNISPVRHVEYRGHAISTGIFKRPVAGRIMARELGLDGDAQADRGCHGGPDMAVYAFTQENYEYWAKELGRSDLHDGKFGENLTVTGMPESEVCIGDRFRIGEAVVEVSIPRAPCSKLAMVMDDPEFPKRFLESLDVGFYLRVVREGLLGAGDAIERIHADPARLSIREVTRLMFFERENIAGAAARAKWRRKFGDRVPTPST